MKTEQSLVPKLRFKGYSSVWHTKTIEQVLEKVSKPVAVIDDQKYNQIGIRSHGKGIFYKDPVTGESLGNKRVFWIQPECLIVNIIFAWEHAIAKSTVSEKGMVASHRFPMYSPVGSQCTIDFILRFFLRKRGKYLLGLASPGGAGRNKTLGQKDFGQLKIQLPTLPEQEKIAAFLTSVDDRIDQLKRKKSLLQDYKKGVMQKLFSQELRFKDDNGKPYPDWEEKKLGEVLTIGSGKDYKHLNEGDIPVYGSGGLMTYVDQFLYEGESVCIGRKGTINKPQFMSGKFWTVDTLFYTHDFKGVIPRFILSIFQNIEWYRYNEAGGVPSLSKKTIDSILVNFPSLPEQTKIANFLNSLDQKIEQIDTQVNQTQTFKKGLLQQMFV